MTNTSNPDKARARAIARLNQLCAAGWELTTSPGSGTGNLPLIAEPEPWVQQAACRNTETYLFFPERGNHDDINEARRACSGCPVSNDCLEYALRTSQRYGIWGGVSERERKVMRTEIRRRTQRHLRAVS